MAYRLRLFVIVARRHPSLFTAHCARQPIMTPRARQDIRESQVVPVSFMVVDHEFMHTLKNVSRVYVPFEAPMAT